MTRVPRTPSRLALFHGTAADLQAGHVVRPAGYRSDHSVWGETGEDYDQRADEHAFATEKEHQAWNFAHAAVDHRGGVGRARVLQVEPAGPSHVGVYHPDHPYYVGETIHEHVSKVGYRVTGSIDTMPGRQGTFPVDWSPFRRSSSYANVNHPDHDEVELGHMGSQFRRSQGHVEPPVPEHPGQLELFERPATEPWLPEYLRRHEPSPVPAQTQPTKRRSLNTLGARQ